MRPGFGWASAALAAACAWLAVQAPALAATDDVVTTNRILTLLEAVSGEYREAMVDGALVRPTEYEEAKIFLGDAQALWAGLAIASDEQLRLSSTLDEIGRALEARQDLDQVHNLIVGARQRIIEITGVTPEIDPPQAPSATRGRSLFLENCSSCHGERGDGRGENATRLNRPPANFTDRAFMHGETPYDFFHVITLGKPNSAMPAWGEVLTIQERWDLISYLWTLAPGEARLAEGQGIYLTQCAGCHGVSGNGQGVWSAALLKPVPDLTQLSHLARLTDLQMQQVVAEGKAGTPMPAFEGALAGDEREKAVVFLRFLSLGAVASGGGEAGDGSGGRGSRVGKLARLLGSSYDAAVGAGKTTDTVELNEAIALTDQLQDAVRPLAAKLPREEADRLIAQSKRLQEQVRAQAAPAGVTEIVAEVAALALQAEPPLTNDGVDGAAAGAAEAALAESTRLLAAAVVAYGKGDPQALALASDAYFAFEPIEKHLGGIAPELKSGVEGKFLELRQALKKRGAEADVQRAVDAIREQYVSVRHKLEPSSGTGLILQSAGIILREGFEIVLVIGALLGYVIKAGYPQMRRFIQAGMVAGVVASFITAFAFGELLRRNPGSSDALEGLTMLFAAVVLFCVSYWLVSKAEADRWQRYIRSKVHGALEGRRKFALIGAAFLAVYREGFETVLFYQALHAGAPEGTSSIGIGIVLGSVALAIVYVLLRRFQVRMPLAQFFLVTGVFLYAMAAIFAGQGIFELQEVGYVPMTALPVMPTLPLLGIYPTVETTLAQAVFVGLLIYAYVTIWRRRAAATTAAQSVDWSTEVRNLQSVVAELCLLLRAAQLQDQDGKLVPAAAELERVSARLDKLAQGTSPSEVRA